jgi:hypothetical protein
MGAEAEPLVARGRKLHGPATRVGRARPARRTQEAGAFSPRATIYLCFFLSLAMRH